MDLDLFELTISRLRLLTLKYVLIWVMFAKDLFMNVPHLLMRENFVLTSNLKRPAERPHAYSALTVILLALQPTAVLSRFLRIKMEQRRIIGRLNCLFLVDHSGLSEQSVIKQACARMLWCVSAWQVVRGVSGVSHGFNWSDNTIDLSHVLKIIIPFLVLACNSFSITLCYLLLGYEQALFEVLIPELTRTDTEQGSENLLLHTMSPFSLPARWMWIQNIV